MDQAWDGTCGPRPSTASVQVRELSWQGLHNPCPQSKDRGSHGGSHCEPLVEYLSPARLQALAQVDDLRLVSMLEMCVNTRDNSLGTFGVHLPNLRHLKLNGSCLGSVRDLGTSLGHLQVLWLARCGLTDLDGIGSFPALKELYVSYNDISDLSPLCLLEQLEVLDLEGNSVEGLGQLRYLQLCPRLATLTLEGNLVCLQPSPCNKAPQGYNYRAEIVPMKHPFGDSALSCPCLRPSPRPRGPGPSPCWSLGTLCLKVCFPRTQPQRMTPATSPMVPARSSAGTPPRACGSAGTSPRPGHPRSSCPHIGWKTRLPPWGLTLQTAMTSWPWLGFRPGGSSACEPSRISGYVLLPPPHKLPRPPESGSGSWWSTDLQFWGRRLRALGSLKPGPGQGLAAVTALKALAVAAGPSPQAQGCPGPTPAPGPVVRPPGLQGRPHLSPITPAQSHP
ncbi:leucine-rich repeat-containing protein 56 isoform X6 [Manis pentadactyla]|uniref:leucine-rich repeat-containing protein 56 isoform X6 n=1 Tax=Manis pentadactyla TaxID=143292 RepID=UPI00255C5087|nr:leucine-rich repeat-containing protein 56 isoform X6 [Manis pentadactyla]